MQTKGHKLFFYIVLIINVVYYIQSRVSHGFSLTTQLNPRDLLEVGGISPSTADIPSIFTASIQHGSIIHLAMNMIVLYAIMQMYEKKIGFFHLMIVYIITSIGSSIAIITFSDEYVVTVGASGAVLGMMGNALIHSLFDHESRHMLSSLVTIVAIQVVVTFLNDNISISGHIGGITVGVILGLIYQTLRYIGQLFTKNKNRTNS